MPPTIFHCRIDAIEDDRLEDYRHLLDEAERQRLAKLTRPAVRRQFLAARALLRLTLAAELGCAPQALELDQGEHGKPRLRWPQPGRAFNLAHSGNRVVLAVSRDGSEVGVDVEHHGRRNSLDMIARRYFSRLEQQQLSALPSAARRYRFFQLWTLKEACAKALGRGLAMTLDGISLDIDGAEGPRLSLTAGAACSGTVGYWHLPLPDDYSLAMAVIGDTTVAEPPVVLDVVPGEQGRPLDVRPDLAGCRLAGAAAAL